MASTSTMKAASRFYINKTHGGGQITVPKAMVKALKFENKEQLKLVIEDDILIISRL